MWWVVLGNLFREGSAHCVHTNLFNLSNLALPSSFLPHSWIYSVSRDDSSFICSSFQNIFVVAHFDAFEQWVSITVTLPLRIPSVPSSTPILSSYLPELEHHSPANISFRNRHFPITHLFCQYRFRCIPFGLIIAYNQPVVSGSNRDHIRRDLKHPNLLHTYLIGLDSLANYSNNDASGWCVAK